MERWAGLAEWPVAALHARNHGERDLRHADLCRVNRDKVVAMHQEFEHPSKAAFSVYEAH